MKRFIATLRAIARRLILTREEREIVAANDAAKLARCRLAVLARTETNGRALLASLAAPHRWMPDDPLTKGEAQTWEQFVLGPIGHKIDVAMLNWAQQQAQEAIARPGEQLAHSAGFARGCMAGWQMAKTLSRMAHEEANPEPDATTVSAGLEQHQP